MVVRFKREKKYDNFVIYSPLKGNRAIFLALLIARASSLWCRAQFPVNLLGFIFPRSLM
jgi:hypothetical protein